MIVRGKRRIQFLRAKANHHASSSFLFTFSKSEDGSAKRKKRGGPSCFCNALSKIYFFKFSVLYKKFGNSELRTISVPQNL